MTSASLNPGRPIGIRFLKVQFVIIVVVSLLAALISGSYAALSAFLGGMVGFIANAYAVYRVFRYSGARNSSRILQSFFMAEAYKMGISALGLGLLFWSQKFVAAAVFIGYIASLIAYWSFPFISEKATRKQEDFDSKDG